MENKPALQQSKTFEVSVLSKISTASKGLSVFDADEEQIKQALRYIFVLIGLPSDKIPMEEDRYILMMFIKNNLSTYKIEEIKLAFDLAVLKHFPVDLTLYGEPFSVKYLTNVVDSYKQFRAAEARRVMFKSKQAEAKTEMNNVQRLGAITDLLSEETKELIDRIGKQKEKMAEIRKHPYYHIHQQWFKQFDFLLTKFRHKYDHEGKEINGKFIHRYGKIMDVEMFFNKKVEQLQLSKERKKDIIL